MSRHVYSRTDWNARPPRTGHTTTGNEPVREAFLHHSDDPDYTRFNTLARQCAHMREIQNFHMDGRGWGDFAYHFAVFQPIGGIRTARIFRGRPTDTVPAAQEQHNSHTLAIVVIGHGDHDLLKVDTLRAVTWLLHAHHSLVTLGGHRDVVSTDCPGDRFYGKVRSIAAMADLRPHR